MQNKKNMPGHVLRELHRFLERNKKTRRIKKQKKKHISPKKHADKKTIKKILPRSSRDSKRAFAVAYLRLCRPATRKRKRCESNAALGWLINSWMISMIELYRALNVVVYQNRGDSKIDLKIL